MSRLVLALIVSESATSLAWNYRDEIDGVGGDDGEGASEDEVVLSADERKRARLGHGATRPRGRSFVRGGQGKWCAHFFFSHNNTCSLGGCRCEHVLRTELVLGKISAPFVFSEMKNVVWAAILAQTSPASQISMAAHTINGLDRT